MRLATYLPFYRIHEVELYFMKNVEYLKPSEAIVYVDNVYHEAQRSVLSRVLPGGLSVRFGNWRSRGATWFTMLRDFYEMGGDVMVVDSDNVVKPQLANAHTMLKGYGIYTILDEEAWGRGRDRSNFVKRSRPMGELNVGGLKVPLYSYRVYDDSIGGMFRGGSVFFIGPKQVIYMGKVPEPELVNKVERAFMGVNRDLRPFISDETVLGVLAYLMGFREVPWTVMSNHLHHGSTPGYATKPLIAMAHYQFAKGLYREFKRREFLRYEFKYALSLIRNIFKWS